MIPQLLHWVLPYNAELGRDQKRAIGSWREHHPSWRALIWAADPVAVAAMLADLDCEVRALPLLVNHRLYSLLGCHGERGHQRDYPRAARAIVASIEVVARYGGVCPPIGEFCACNIESLLQGVRLFARDTRGYVSPDGEKFETMTAPIQTAINQAALPLYGATPNHPALWNVVRDLRNITLDARSENGAVCAASLAELVLFRLGRHSDNVFFPAAAFEVNSCSTL